jgi:hypothetical protein
VRDTLLVAQERADELALRALLVIEIVLQPEIVGSHLGHDLDRLADAAEIEARDVEAVDRLDQQADSGRPQLIRGEPQIVAEGCPHLVGLDARRRDTGEAVDLLAAERRRVVDRPADAVL